ncbi:L-aspartate oxidase [Nocardiopsis ansamitocini]|uniref:L-aspartate oxidase n=1 Tax=Nocardiopsis ansamitocini TaxID=1670832 RepID=A0A9W6UI63_9ACTN|nr:L-aspartate oxidase [Nocardiopsis ansamitocini]GLU47359.1 hypothetical protein Nans01_17100 [Nocardiopsis ansamitocini]
MRTGPSPLPLRLTAPEPGWTIETDVVVVGSGIAGLSTALGYVEQDPGGRVVLVTKDLLTSGSTRWAQGGIAAALDPADDPLAHMVDTVEAGAGMCDTDAVRILTEEGPAALRWLIAKGTAFDRTEDGALSLTREGGHRADRIAHAGGDATGAEIERALVEAVRAESRIELVEHAFVPDLLLAEAGAGEPRVRGLTVHVMGEGERDGVGSVLARAVVLATGGLGQVFAATTNPEVSTGDGIALGLRAGAEARDLEFVQFHPTVLWLGPDSKGRQPLVSEAVRGEGAFLVDAEGRRFMTGVHELADLAPRDVVATAIARVMAETGTDHVHLDARHFGADVWERRFPTILASCRAHGIDPVTDLVPVSPAAHYASGGLAVDLDGRTSVPGLYAVGEVARTGVHGANRLASNSLLEGIVFAGRIAARLAGEEPVAVVPTAPAAGAAGTLVDPAVLPDLQACMSRHVGVRRDAEGLEAARAELGRLADTARGPVEPGVAAWQAANMLTVATVLVQAAIERTETRGAHWRADYPVTSPLAQGVCSGLGVDGLARSWTVPTTGADSGVRAAQRTAGYEVATAFADRLPAGPRQAPPPELGPLVAGALHEDLLLGPGGELLAEGYGVDVTSAATIPAAQIRTADVVARADGVVAGLPLAEAVFRQVCQGVLEVRRHAADGDVVKRGDVLLTVRARTRDLLTAERTALNFLTHLSGIASATRAWVEAVAGTGAAVRDSRKTHAGLRTLEKYAVRCGGGVNHRFGLTDAALIKDNHVLAAGGVAQAVRAVRERFPDVPLEVEVDRIDQIEPALAEGAEEILLDNFTVAELREAVELVAGRARLESSGGLTLDVAADVAATGVDYLAVGALTHSSPALDIALDLRQTP